MVARSHSRRKTLQHLLRFRSTHKVKYEFNIKRSLTGGKHNLPEPRIGHEVSKVSIGKAVMNGNGKGQTNNGMKIVSKEETKIKRTQAPAKSK